MFPVYFSAILKTAEGRLMEIGEACLSRHENKVTFKSEFVPLVKLDTAVEIVRVLGQKQLERFKGNVYLSSRSLLQIINVDPQIMDEVRVLFDINTCLPASFTISPEKTSVFPSRRVEMAVGTVRYLSRDVIKLSLLPFVGEGRYITVDCQCEGLSLRQTVVHVEKRELLGRKAALLLCSITSCPPSELTSLCAYVDGLAKLDEEVDAEGEAPPDDSPDGGLVFRSF